MQNKDKNKSENSPLNKKPYEFGGIEVFSLDKIEDEILSDSLYLDVFAGSDIAFKTNINPMDNVSSKIKDIRCITYDYKTEEFANKNFPSSNQIGVIAQDLLPNFPQLLRKDNSGNFEVNYTQLATVSLQALKEVIGRLEAAEEKIKSLEEQLSRKN